MKSEIYNQYLDLYRRMNENDSEMIPLCAAQTYISDFCKQPLTSNFEGKYSFVDKNGDNSFIDGKFLEELNDLLSKQCKKLFNANYVNADTMTGINCFTVCAMAVLNRSHRVLITTPEQGGHPSIPVILEHLDISYDSFPYNYEYYQINYEETNKLIKDNKYDFIIFCQSDILQLPDLSKLKLGDVGVIYDATQTLGLICGGAVTNPLDFENVILLGGSHKTLPAPACGLIMTNSEAYVKKLKLKITPELLRNTQPNHIAALLLSLIEQEQCGEEYQNTVIKIANELGEELEQFGMKIAKLSQCRFTDTHQIFILLSMEEADSYYNNAQTFNISLNKKNKELVTGIRIGTQQIARYNWNKENIKKLAALLFKIQKPQHYIADIKKLRKELIAQKIPNFQFEEIIIE